METKKKIKDIRLRHQRTGEVLGFEIMMSKGVEIDATLELRNFLADRLEEYLTQLEAK